DGIRYRNVTGVQTCALPISFYDLGLFDIGLLRSYRCAEVARALNPNIQTIVTGFSGMEKRVTEEHERRYCSGRQGKPARLGMARSEERRVGEVGERGRRAME